MNIGIGLVVYKESVKNILKLNESFNRYKLKYKVVVDNSPSNSLKSNFELNGWKYYHNPLNPGFAKSHNFIIKKYNTLAQYHLVVNPDIYFEHDVLAKLKEFMDYKNDCGIVMPRVLYPDGRNQKLVKLLPSPYGWFLRRFFKRSIRLKKYNEKFELTNVFNETDIFKAPYLSGCFMFIRTKDLLNVGLFDESIFMYGEDTDLSRRFWNAKSYPYYYGKSIIYHQFSKGSHKSFNLLFIAIKSTLYYFNKWGWFDKERIKINKECLNQFK